MVVVGGEEQHARPRGDGEKKSIQPLRRVCTDSRTMCYCNQA